MSELSSSQKARLAIRTFKAIADALILRGFYKPSGKSGKKLAESLQAFEPEIYGSMSDNRIVELHGMEYIMDRMPRGIEKCNRIILTADENFQDTSFEEITPLKRRRQSYIVSEKEICFVITRGLTEIYDILTHITFINLESYKIFRQFYSRVGGVSAEWSELEETVGRNVKLTGPELDQALWNLSIILGRTYRETRDSYQNLDVHHKKNGNHNNGLFATIFEMGRRAAEEVHSKDKQLTIYFTPSLQEMVGHHKYASLWEVNLKKHLSDRGLLERSFHIISANMHSVPNLVYGAGYLKKQNKDVSANLYEMVTELRDCAEDLLEYATDYGLSYLPDTSESNIDVIVIDIAENKESNMHSSISCDYTYIAEEKPVILVIDYAFGTQAFDIMDELLGPCRDDGIKGTLTVESINIMGKAGVLGGKKGDIMLATAHVMEGTPNNYIVENDLMLQDFDTGYPIHEGPIVTVLGTSLQNRDVLTMFHKSAWKAVGLEMEGGHYQRAISAAMIKGYVPKNMKVRYAYYASDNPLRIGETLASGSMGDVGVVPTYMITKVILQKIVNRP